jgi:phosphate transport system permease protein
MTTTITPPETRGPAAAPVSNSLTAGKLPNGASWMVLGASLLVSAGLFGVLAFAGAEFNLVGTILVGAILYVATITLLSRIVEGARRATDRFVTALVTGAFLLAMVPLVSLTITVVTFGLNRFDAEFFTYSMRNITG